MILGFSLLGCARTVTTIDSFGTQMRVSVKLRGDIDINNNRYFMVLSSSESFAVPLPPPDSMDEFLEPGDLPQSGSVEAYYSDYYSTWNGYVVLDQTGYYISKGPFVFGTSSTRETLATLTEITDTVSFVFRLDQIFGGSIPDTIYFDILCVNYPDSSAKYIKDHVSPPLRNISKLSGSLASESDETSMTIDPSLDIISWAVEIE